MGGSHGNHALCKAAADGHGAQEQALRHGGAGPIQPQKRNAQIPQTKAGADALVQQIAAKQDINVLGLQMGFFQRCLYGQGLHLRFCFLPGGLAEFCIGIQMVKPGMQRTFQFFFPANSGGGQENRTMLKHQGLTAGALYAQFYQLLHKHEIWQ